MRFIPPGYRFQSLFIGALTLVLVVGCATQEEPGSTTTGAVEDPRSNQQQSEVTEDNEREGTTEPTPEPSSASTAMPSSVADYIDLANRDYERPEGMDKYDHAFTADRLRGLAGALEDSANTWGLNSNRRNQLREDVKTLRRVADRIQEDRIVPHSEFVRTALDAGVDALGIFLGKGATGKNQHAQISEAAESFDPDVVLLKQKGTLVTYFNNTATFFEKLYG